MAEKFHKIVFAFTTWWSFSFFRERGKGKREGDKYQCVAASHTFPTGDLAHNPGICLDWESNR